MMGLRDRFSKTTRRVRRRLFGGPDPDCQELAEQIQQFVRIASPRISCFLDFAREKGAEGLNSLRGESFHASISPLVFQIGDEQDLGYVVLPEGRLFQTRFPSETVVVSVKIGADYFYVRLSAGDQGEITIVPTWKSGNSQALWPDTPEKMLELQSRIQQVVSLLSDLMSGSETASTRQDEAEPE